MITMSSKLFLVGMLLVFIGMLILIFSSISFVLSNVGNASIATGALIMIGPIPILIGAGIPPIALIFLIILMLALMILQLYMFFSFKKLARA